MKKLHFIQDIDRTLSLIGKAGDWMERTGKNPSFYWKSVNLTRDNMIQFAEPHEFYIGELGGIDVVGAILTESQKAQDWSLIDIGVAKQAIYIHWLAVNRDFTGKGFPGELIKFAKELALSKGINLLRVDTDASREKLRAIYESFGFELIQIIDEEYRKGAFYQITL